MTLPAVLPGVPPVVVTGENTAEAARQAARAEGYANDAGQAQIIAIRRESLLDFPNETSSALNEAATAETALLQSILARGGSAIYCSSTATGANDGTSWANAYTSLSAAILAASPGDTVFTNAPETTPFPTTAANSASLADYISIIGDQGPDGATWISGLKKSSSWVDSGGGVFSLSGIGSTVYAAAYDLKRDTLNGSASGVNLTTAKNVADLASWGLDPNDCRAWLGTLEQASPATTTPAENQWSSTGGVLYINPPGSPTLADVNAKAGYATSADGLSFQKTGGLHKGLHVSGITTFFTPAFFAGTGYGIKHNGCENSVFSDCLFIMSGYHSLGTIGNSGEDIVFRNCVSVQNAPASGGSAQAFVFYSSGSDMPASGCIGANLVQIGIPMLKASGAPIGNTYAPALGYSHTDAASVLGGVRWVNPLQIDFVAEINAAKGTALTTGGRFITSGNDGSTYSDDDGGFTNKVIGGKARGSSAIYQWNIEHRGVVIDREGYGSANLILQSLNEPSGDVRYRILGGEFRTGDYRRIWGNMVAADLFIFDGARVVLQANSNTFNPSLIHGNLTTAGRIKFRNCIFDSTSTSPSHIVQGNGAMGTSWANIASAISSNGANVFGENVTQFIGSEAAETGAYTPKDATWWKGNVTGALGDLTEALNPAGLS